MTIDWRKRHGRVIREFLNFVNKQTDSFALKGGTALAQCYKLSRFSEDIDMDAEKENIVKYVDEFCKSNEYSYRVGKDTPTVKRCFINYGNEQKPLKIEVSYRQKHINLKDVNKIHGINVYSIDRLAQMKSNAYNARDKIRDLYDLSFICNVYLDKLQESTINVIRDAISYKGLEQFDYLVTTQKDELINNDQLADAFLKMHESLGLLCDDAEKKIAKDLKHARKRICSLKNSK